MSDGHGISEENLLNALPVALRRDKSALGLAGAAAWILAMRPDEIGALRIYGRIDELPEELLDILAYDLKVDWWDGNYTLEEKRRTLKENWFVHRHLGTKAAVERALSAIYPGAAVEEWFDYGGEPHHFRITVKTAGTLNTLQEIKQFLRLVSTYKRLSSWLDDMIVTTDLGERPLYLGGLAAEVIRMPVPELGDTFRFNNAALRVGGLAAEVCRVPVAERPDTVTLAGTVRFGGTGAAVLTVPIPEMS